MEDQPNIEWYLHISRERRVAPRCPFATVERCPRYLASLSLLREMGFTGIEEEEDRRLHKKWGNSELLPRMVEQDTSVFGSPTSKCLANYCPEVSFDHYGVFASLLCEHSDDETDRDIAFARLLKNGVPQESWQWRWSDLRSMHYTECALYSPLMHQPISPLPDKPNEDLVTLKPTVWGMSIDLNGIWRRLWPWLRRLKKP